MERITSILKKLKIDHLVDRELLKEFKIKKLKKDTLVLASGDFPENMIYILNGEVKAHIYTDEGGVFYGLLKENEFFGLISIILNKPLVPDFITTKQSEILLFPLKKIMTTRKNIMDIIWKEVAIKTAEESSRVISYTVKRATSSNELFFLKHLENNNGIINYSNTTELSENLNIHLRTLQRIIKKLSEKGVIEKSRKTIKIKDQVLFEKEKKLFMD